MSNKIKFNSKLDDFDLENDDFSSEDSLSENFNTPITQKNHIKNDENVEISTNIEDGDDIYGGVDIIDDNDVDDSDCKKIKVKNIFSMDFSEEETDYEKMLNDLQNEYINDVTITIANFKERALTEAYIRGKWCSRLFAEKAHLANLKETEEALVQELSVMVAEKRRSSSFLTEQMSLNKVLDNDKTLKTLRKNIKKSAFVESFLTNVYNDIKNLTYSLKNIAEATKLEMGL